MYYIVSLAKFGNCCSMVWAHRQGQWKCKNFSLSFSEAAKIKLRIVLHCIFGRDFLSPRTKIVSDIKNYPSANTTCCSDNLAQLLSAKTIEVWDPKIYQSENKVLLLPLIDHLYLLLFTYCVLLPISVEHGFSCTPYFSPFSL